MDKGNGYTHTFTHTMEYYSFIKKKILPFATKLMELSETSQTEKDKYCMISHI